MSEDQARIDELNRELDEARLALGARRETIKRLSRERDEARAKAAHENAERAKWERIAAGRDVKLGDLRGELGEAKAELDSLRIRLDRALRQRDEAISARSEAIRERDEARELRGRPFITVDSALTADALDRIRDAAKAQDEGARAAIRHLVEALDRLAHHHAGIGNGRLATWVRRDAARAEEALAGEASE